MKCVLSSLIVFPLCKPWSLFAFSEALLCVLGFGICRYKQMGWGRGSAVENTSSSFREPGFGPSIHMAVVTPVLEDPLLVCGTSWVLHVVHIIYADTHHTDKRKLK